MSLLPAALGDARSATPKPPRPPTPPQPPKPPKSARFHDEDVPELEPGPVDEDDAEDAPMPEGPEPDPVSDAVAYAEARTRRNHLKREVAMAIGLAPFPFTAAPFSGGWIGWVVFFNGVSCHGYGALMVGDRLTRWLANWDIAWNVGLCVYVNRDHWRPCTAALTVTSAAIWHANGGWQSVRSAGLRRGVQWILCALLFVYEYGGPSVKGD